MMSSIRPKITPVTGIGDIDSALDDHDLLSRAFADAVEAMARHAMVGRTVFHATLLLDDIRRQFERGNKP